MRFDWQISLQEESQKILVSDCFSLHERLVRIHQRGMAIRGDAQLDKRWYSIPNKLQQVTSFFLSQMIKYAVLVIRKW